MAVNAVESLALGRIISELRKAQSWEGLARRNIPFSGLKKLQCVHESSFFLPNHHIDRLVISHPGLVTVAMSRCHEIRLGEWIHFNYME